MPKGHGRECDGHHSVAHTHTRTHARTHKHARTHARTHTHTHTRKRERDRPTDRYFDKTASFGEQTETSFTHACTVLDLTLKDKTTDHLLPARVPAIPLKWAVTHNSMFGHR